MKTNRKSLDYNFPFITLTQKHEIKYIKYDYSVAEY